MPKRSAGVSLPFLSLDPEAGEAPLHRRLYERLREAILSGTLAPRSRLPSTRRLCSELGVSRGTVELAFSQWDAEGFLARRAGARRLSPLYLGRKAEQGLLLGFSGASPAGLRAAVKTLRGLLPSPRRSASRLSASRPRA